MPWIKYNFLFDSRVAAGGGSMMDQLFILLKLYSKRHIHQRSFYFIRRHVTYPTSLKGCYKEIPHFKPNLFLLVALVTGWKQLKRIISLHWSVVVLTLHLTLDGNAKFDSSSVDTYLLTSIPNFQRTSACHKIQLIFVDIPPSLTTTQLTVLNISVLFTPSEYFLNKYSAICYSVALACSCLIFVFLR